MATVCDISTGGQNLSFKKSRSIKETTENDDWHKKLEDTLGNIGIDIPFSVLVRVAHSSEPEKIVCMTFF